MKLRVFVCWTSVSGYVSACWRVLSARREVDLRVAAFKSPQTCSAPYERDIAEGLPIELLDRSEAEQGAERVAELVAAHRPDVVVIPGWATPAFSSLAFDHRLESARFVLAMDTPRRDDWRQKLARVGLRPLLSRVERIVVPGERAWQYARQLGFPDSRIHRGMYGVDYAQLEPALGRRLARRSGWPRRFLFAGRYESRKGVDVLLEAYAMYREARGAEEAWPLTCCGKGPLADRVARAEGVEDLGFVQPGDQAEVWSRSGAFVLASRYDPWPLVIAEACASGLPVLCTAACGSAVELVRSHYNGVIVGTDDAEAIARGMSLFHDRYEQLPEMGRRSQQLAAPYAAEIWAERWVQMCRDVVRSEQRRPAEVEQGMPEPGTRSVLAAMAQPSIGGRGIRI